MRGLRPALSGIAALAVVFGLANVALIITSDFQEVRGLIVVLELLGGWGFVGAGLLVWARRPDNRIGAVMVLAGFMWMINGAPASDLPLVFSIGVLLSNLFAAALIHLLLAFPSGELKTRAERLTVLAGYFITTAVLIPVFVFTNPVTEDCDDCPRFIFEAANSDFADTFGMAVLNLSGSLLLIAVLVMIGRRWRAAGRPERRILLPIYAAGGTVLASLTLSLLAQLLSLPDGASEVLFFIAAIAFVLMPYLFLGGLIRSRVLRAGAVSDLIARLAETPEPGELREALARALGDRSLTLAYWIPGAQRYIDADGQPADLPADGSGRMMTLVERDGERVAAIIHRELTDDEEELLAAVGSAAALALENQRLDAELRSRLEELRASRARIVEAGVTERRRLERDLHDGAQQRLVSLALTLRIARDKIAAEPAGAAALLDGAGAELELALGELRELARGIHPAVLSDRGLGAALEALAGRAPLPVELEHRDGECFPDAVESAAYFVVAEALTNVAKYSQASSARVAVARENGHVLVEVADDGVGGADPDRGTGLRGLSDRISALDGRLVVTSPPGGGTTVKATIPCA